MEFQAFPKIARLSRDCTITEKLDGTNACVVIAEDGTLYTQSRSRLITPGDDNYGFARWAHENADELRKLGPGYHYGEWWGAGIQRKYGLTEKRFSLFNVGRWNVGNIPACCHVVPTIYVGVFDTFQVQNCIEALRLNGSAAAPGFMNPEGVMVYHHAAGVYFKKTLEKDAEPKGKQ